jgi:SAM-dependent methyltransferase
MTTPKTDSSRNTASTEPQPKSAECFCNLCQATRTFTQLYIIEGHVVGRCNICNLVFVVREAGPAVDVARLYSKEYFEGGVPDGYSDYNASEETLRQQAGRMVRKLRKYQPSGTLLEIGCAYGFFLLEASKFFEVKGVEISTFAAEQARNRGLDVTAGDFQVLPFPESHFSAVCLFDCIEHLADPFTYLRKIHSVLRPGGIVALTTGDVGSLYGRVSGRKWRLMTPPQHLFYFSKSTLAGLLEKTGFEMVETSYPWKLVPWRLVLYQLSPRLKNALGPLGRLPLGLYVNLFDAMFVLARKR